MAESPRFIAVGDLLAEIGAGLGRANAEVAMRAANPIGTLVVKSAEVDLSMELTSQAQSNRVGAAAGVPLLGAKTLSFGSESLKSSSVNRLQIKLQLVAVQAPGSEPT